MTDESRNVAVPEAGAPLRSSSLVVSPGQEAVGQEHGDLDRDNEAACAAFGCRFIERLRLGALNGASTFSKSWPSAALRNRRCARSW